MSQAATVTQLKPAAFVIERGIPLPLDARSRTGNAATPLTMAIRALAAAEVGASFLFPEATPNKCVSIRVAAQRAGGAGWVAVRKEGGGARVWKIAEPDPAKARKR